MIPVMTQFLKSCLRVASVVAMPLRISAEWVSVASHPTMNIDKDDKCD
jgi:hypothetical protein